MCQVLNRQSCDDKSNAEYIMLCSRHGLLLFDIIFSVILERKIILIHFLCINFLQH